MLLPCVLLALLGGTAVADAACAFPPPRGRAEPAVTCRAQAYRGPFSCSWQSRCLATLQLPHRWQGPQGCSSRAALSPAGVVHVRLHNCTFCSYAEGREVPLELVVRDESGRHATLAPKTLLHDHVTPAPPERLVARAEAQRRVALRWAPPASWDRPASYFPLQYHLQLHLLRAGNHTVELFSEGLEETREYQDIAFEARIRCRDALSRSAWSSWSSWVDVQREPSGGRAR